jgi:hypothetical protein
MAAIDKLKSLAGRKAADRSSVAAQIAASPVEDDLPIPSNINTVFLGGLFSFSDACRLLCGSRDHPANRPHLCAQPCADAGNAGARAGAFAARGSHPRHPGAVWHAWRAGDGAVGTGGQLGAETAQ